MPTLGDDELSRTLPSLAPVFRNDPESEPLRAPSPDARCYLAAGLTVAWHSAPAGEVTDHETRVGDREGVKVVIAR